MKPKQLNFKKIMKKILFFLLLSHLTYGQQYVGVLPNNGGIYGGDTAPQGAYRYVRACYIISPTEMAASNLPISAVLSSLSFEFYKAQNAPTTGNLKIYIQNTNDASYLKTSEFWVDVINNMTLVHDATTTIPAVDGFWDIPFSGGSTFTYTGGGVYVAFEYSNPTGPVVFHVDRNRAYCNTEISGGVKSNFSSIELPDSISLVPTFPAFRPATRFGYVASCYSPTQFLVSNILSTTATVSFDTPSITPANGYEYYISTSNTPPTASTTPSGSVTTSSINLTGLTPNTLYYVWVRSVCSTTDKSVWWSTPTQILTAVVPTYQSAFDNENDTRGWSLPYSGELSMWEVYEGPIAASAPGYARHVSYGDLVFAWMFSRDIELTAGVEYQISFKVRAGEYLGALDHPESMRATIGIGKTPAAQNTILWDSGLDGINYIVWRVQSATFTPTITSSYNLGFHPYTTPYDYATDLYVDDFIISVNLSVNEQELEKSFEIFPIPIYDNFNLSSNVYNVNSVEIIDINGRIVKVFHNSSENYNISELNSGVYLVKINGDNQNVIKKVIKK